MYPYESTLRSYSETQGCLFHTQLSQVAASQEISKQMIVEYFSNSKQNKKSSQPKTAAVTSNKSTLS